MITVRKSFERGHADHGWLDTYHTFSFAGYRDPDYTQFRSLRVMNEDRVRPGKGFGTHPHDNMEIITYVLSGQLEHRDSLGNGSVITAGEIQRISAGTGVLHSEFNPSDVEPVHFYQIWILPKERDVQPHYDQRSFDGLLDTNKLSLIVSGDGRQETIPINQDVDLYAARLSSGQEVRYSLANGRHGWLQVASGDVTVNDVYLGASDGAQIGTERELSIKAGGASEILLFDLA